MVGYNSHNRTWRLWDPTDGTRITQSAEVSFGERSTRDVEPLQEDQPRLPVLIDGCVSHGRDGTRRGSRYGDLGGGIRKESWS